MNQSAEVTIEKGSARCLLAADCGWNIDVPAARRLLSKSPGHGLNILPDEDALRFPVHPLTLQSTRLPPIKAADKESTPGVVLKVTESGVISAELKFDLAGYSMPELVEFAHALDEDRDGRLREHGTSLIRELAKSIERHITEPVYSGELETYRTYWIQKLIEEVQAIDLLETHKEALAHILRGEKNNLAVEQVEDALKVAISYFKDERTIIDTRNAVLLGNASFSQVSTVLGFTVIELLELKSLESFLKNLLETDSRLKNKIAKFKLDELRVVEQDIAIQIGRVSNPLDLNDDHYFADVRRLIAQRLGLSNWAEEVQAKLKVVENISDNLRDRSKHRLDVSLEVAVVALVAYEVIHMIFAK